MTEEYRRKDAVSISTLGVIILRVLLSPGEPPLPMYMIDYDTKQREKTHVPTSGRFVSF